MTESSLICWYCSDVRPIIGHDDDYNLVCTQCQLDLLPGQTIQANLSALTGSEAITAAQAEYQTQLRAFQQQEAELLTFYQTTKDLPWRLLLGRQDQPTWNQYYQAAVKNLALLHDQFDHIKALLTVNLVPSAYPELNLTPPGKIVKVWPRFNNWDHHDSDKVTIVVSDYYLDLVTTTVNSKAAKVSQLTYENVLTKALEIKDIIRKLSLNSNLTLTYLQQNPTWDWPWDELHQNTNFDITWLTAFPDKPWDFRAIALMENCQIDWLSQHPKLTLWDYMSVDNYRMLPATETARLTLTNLKSLLRLPGLAVRTTAIQCQGNWIDNYMICKYIDLNQALPGDQSVDDSVNGKDPNVVLKFLQLHYLVRYDGLSANQTFHWPWLSQLIPPFDNTWDWCSLSTNKSLNATVLENLYQHCRKHAEKTYWSPSHLSYNDAFEVAWLKKPWFQIDINQPFGRDYWDWSNLSCHRNTKLDFILAHPQWPWDMRGLRDNPNFSPEWLEVLSSGGFNKLDWKLADLSYHNLAKLDWQFLFSRPNKLDWRLLSQRDDITWDLIESRPDLISYWYWPSLCRNPNLVWSDHPLWLQNKSKWDAKELSQNPATTWQHVKDHPDLRWDLELLYENSMVVL